MKQTTLFLFFILFTFAAEAAKEDTLLVHSAAMNKKIEVIIFSPEKASDSAPAPSVYLLHGYSGNARQWPTIKTDLPEIADRFHLVLICPDSQNSWYWDSPKDPSSRYETFVSTELVRFIDSHYPTRNRREARAITGLSMGGHGALWIALRHTDTFGAAGSTSGGVDIRPFPKNWEMSKQLGNKETHSQLWESHTVINLIDQPINNIPALIIDCGYDDFFREVNDNFHNKLLKKEIAHDYLVRPGAHNNAYWKNSIDYQFLFFMKYFKSNQ